MRYAAVAGALVLIGVLAYGVFAELNKGSARALRLPCQKETTTFERAYADATALQRAQTLLRRGAYTLRVSTQPSQHMRSTLFERVDAGMIETWVCESAGPCAQARERVEIECLVVENDKLDPGKKTEKAKLYEGYVVFDVRFEGRRLYKVQVDFMRSGGTDIAQRIGCAVQSFLTYKES